MLENRIIDVINTCLVCKKPIQCRPEQTDTVPQWILRCAKHQKQLKKVWPTDFKFWESQIKDEH